MAVPSEGSANQDHLLPRIAAASVATLKDPGPTGGCLALTIASASGPGASLPPTVKIGRGHTGQQPHKEEAPGLCLQPVVSLILFLREVSFSN